ncbi:OLC1v1033558C1 [Oldenlandia corymbosa var. corymbosa]|uniref:OLC1v1033558C1 n=1 Tax=Oldenlandia corymbosa var. corymbosa TaxID=529605 RepID=A0AAV1CRF4_OLDCO|nr:OLC1v1033558C1 [Oldenlandia corymbosa var. corymbosa]
MESASGDIGIKLEDPFIVSKLGVGGSGRRYSSSCRLRMISKESSNQQLSMSAPSHYYRDDDVVAGTTNGVPFLWESIPGTPKHPHHSGLPFPRRRPSPLLLLSSKNPPPPPWLCPPPDHPDSIFCGICSAAVPAPAPSPHPESQRRVNIIRRHVALRRCRFHLHAAPPYPPTGLVLLLLLPPLTAAEELRPVVGGGGHHSSAPPGFVLCCQGTILGAGGATDTL